MIKTRSLVVGSFTLLLLVGTSAWHSAQLKAQQAESSPVPSKVKDPKQTQPARDGPHRQPPPPEALPLLPLPGVRSFTGRVVNVGGRYMLEDALVGGTYDIDPQQAVSAFEGMMVRLNGALDRNGKIIHLELPLRY